jgi:hypothetical protein
MLALAATASADSLKWQRGRSEIKVKSAPTSAFSSSATRAPSSSVNTSLAHSNPLRSSMRRVDLAVRKAAFEDNGPQLGASESRQPYRSVVVREEEPQSFRAAQLEEPATRGTNSNSLDADLSRPMTEPTDELPPLDDPEFDESPMDDQPTSVPDTTTQPDNRLQQTPRQPGGQFQPGIPLQRETAPPLPADVPALSEQTIEEERQKSADACEQGFEDLREKTIDKLDIGIAVDGEMGSDFPYECTLELAWHEGRCWEQTTYMWKASALCHKPLYFEDEQLERYGHSFAPCFQPFVSGAHFFCTLPVLPYCMGVEPPCECIYALGHYRPGNCAPYMCNPIPLSPRGAVFQAGAVTGVSAILP